MVKTYLKIFARTESIYSVPIETLITLFTIQYCESDVSIIPVMSENLEKENEFEINISSVKVQCIDTSQLSEIASTCQLPCLQDSDNSCIAGLCGTLRKIVQIVLKKNPNHQCKSLLGFKESCLLACSESSVWTKFCEIDIISTVKTFNFKKESESLPSTLARFEHHMSQPVRLHNSYKYTMSKKFSTNGIVNKNERILPDHIYAEGFNMTLADIIIFICMNKLFNMIKRENIQNLIPLTLKWYDHIKSDIHIENYLKNIIQKPTDNVNFFLEISSKIENLSLYKGSSKRYKSRNHIFTKQEEVESSLEIVSDNKFELDDIFCNEKHFDWNVIPKEATPEGGDLPQTRLRRKYDQIESLCKPILKLAKPGDRIVDFCSGGGHLGIILAYLLPNCSVTLLENKAESMKKAQKRVKTLDLQNINFIQCNLDYFKGDFEIGTSLHACGVATDLVIQLCIEKRAIFICCPCCYGSVQDCHRITYPRSHHFKKKVDKRSYMVIGHAADQTHDNKNVKTKQGYQCMLVIDTDRKLQATEEGYQVFLNKLTPETCSPKNNLLVGLPLEK